jgi:hypothetical protein
VSAALVAVFDELYAAGELKLGEGKSVVIAPAPLDLDWAYEWD